MPKSFHQKIKILYLMQAFLERTDKEHPMTVKDLQAYLANAGISAERKTVYDDIENLRVFGLDIVNRREKPSGFYLAHREFELAELKLLVDAVQSSKFITSGKSRQLIRKLEGLASVHQARELQRQVWVENRVKSMNESIYHNIDQIHQAISSDRQICFQYCEWTLSKQLSLKRNGERYRISPWKMIWKDENYYLIGYDSRAEQIRHYRVDKMLHILLSEEIREGKEEFQKIDMASYSKKSFGMFGGKEQSVKLLVENSLAGVIVDRFGKDVMMIPADADHFTVSVDVQVSSQFISWVFALGSQAKIVSPKNVVNQVRKEIEKLAEQYALPIENRREN